MARVGAAFGALAGLATGNNVIGTSLVFGAANGLYQGAKHGKGFMWGGSTEKERMTALEERERLNALRIKQLFRDAEKLGERADRRLAAFLISEQKRSISRRRSPARSPVRSPGKMRGGSRWVQKAERSIERKGHTGIFSRKAEEHGVTTTAFACKVLANKDSYDPKTVKQANFYRNINKSHRC